MVRRPDRWRIYALALREAGRASRASLSYLKSLMRIGSPVPTRLLFAPQDLRTSDPTIANDVYAGFFVFAGRALSTSGRSPFDFRPPSRAWGEVLYGFGWLRHLRAAGTALAQANARTLVDEFIAQSRGDQKLARETPILARRLISFMSQSPLLLEGADHAFYQRFLKAIGRAVRDLEQDIEAGALPYQRLVAAIALCYAGLCCEGLDATQRNAIKLLARELDRQILPDGGHVSRNPRLIIELLFDLLPLRQIFASRGVETPEALLQAIDRMLPMVRMFRHGDSTMSHFNGMGVTAADQLATLLMYDEARAQPIQHAPHVGYERLEAGTSLVIADVGAIPPVHHSTEAGAGCLSFEFSSGRQRIVVNCGRPRNPSDAIAQAARSTAAHSTATVADTSSAGFLTAEGWWFDRIVATWLLRRLGPVALYGPHSVVAERTERDQSALLVAYHDGYRSQFGITHERRLQLSATGDLLEGQDSFLTEAGVSANEDVTVRFHLAPGVRASLAQAGRAVMLLLPNREVWQFETHPVEARLEDSVFFSATDGPRRIVQIALTVKPSETPSVRWRFERLTSTGSRAA